MLRSQIDSFFIANYNMMRLWIWSWHLIYDVMIIACFHSMTAKSCINNCCIKAVLLFFNWLQGKANFFVKWPNQDWWCVLFNNSNCWSLSFCCLLHIFKVLRFATFNMLKMQKKKSQSFIVKEISSPIVAKNIHLNKSIHMNCLETLFFWTAGLT